MKKLVKMQKIIIINSVKIYFESIRFKQDNFWKYIWLIIIWNWWEDKRIIDKKKVGGY